MDRQHSEGSRGSSRVMTTVLLTLVLVHFGSFIAMSVYTQSRVNSLQQKLGELSLADDVVMLNAVRDLGEEQGQTRLDTGSSYLDRRKRELTTQSLEQTLRQKQKQISRASCREEIGDVLKILSDVILRGKNVAELVNLRMRIDHWVEKLSGTDSDRQRRQTSPAGNELGNIFEQLANEELAIFDRYCGNASKICLPGAKGEPGVKGEFGVQGNKGDVGAKGDVGPTGLRGAKGETGARGPVGASGPPGPTGNKGLDGIPGRKGETGQKGVAGTDGRDGASGPPGPKGERGVDGMPGRKGEAGVNGAKGERGVAGYNGPAGPKGDQGWPGVPGGRGQKGEPGVWEPGMASCCQALSRPTFTQTGEVISVPQGTTATLHCGATSYPPSTVTWVPATNDARYQTTGQDLVISNAQLSDSGFIRCRATNVLGTSEKTFDFNVIRHLTVLERPQNVTIAEGQSFQLECSFASSPPPIIHWYHVMPDGSRQEVTSGVTQIGGASTLVRQRTSLPDRGEYICEATNGVETASLSEFVTIQSKPYIISTSGPTVVAKEGEDVVLSCVSDSNPPAVIDWNRSRNDSHVFEDAQGRLHIGDIRKVDAGDYTCTATNPLGQDSATITVQVEVPPTATMEPGFQPLKATLFFDCIAHGDQPLTVAWSKGGTPLDLSDRAKYVQLPADQRQPDQHRLLLMGGGDGDVGVYQCHASNAIGSQDALSYVYKDMGQASCDTTFSVCTASLCGVHCPATCQQAAVPVIGTTSYSVMSSVCRAAVHGGTLGENQAGTVVWQTTPQNTAFSPTTLHGVPSSGGAATGLAATPLGVDVHNP